MIGRLTNQLNNRSVDTNLLCTWLNIPGGGRSGPLRANQAISTMTRSPHPRETPTDFWRGTKSATHGSTLTPKRSSSMTNLRGASPDSWSEMGSERVSQNGGLMDTAIIRQAVFDEWRTKKSERLKEQLASKAAEKKKLEEKEKEEHERKKMVNLTNCVLVMGQMHGLLTNHVWLSWLDIGQVLFCMFMDSDRVEVHKHAEKERGQYPAILTE